MTGARIIAIINQKGGVGKSTTALALGAGLTLRKRRVLFVDLDAQGNLSYVLGAEPGGPGVFEVLTRAAAVREVLLTAEAGDLLPSSPALAGADTVLTQTGKEYRLKEALGELAGDYDFIVIDTPPALGVLTINALTAAGRALVPAQADVFSLQGVGQLHQTIEAVRQYCNPDLKILGLLLTRHNGRSVLSRELAEMLAETAAKLQTRLFAAAVRETVAVREAQARRQSLLAYAPHSTAARDYLALADEVLKIFGETSRSGRARPTPLKEPK